MAKLMGQMHAAGGGRGQMEEGATRERALLESSTAHGAKRRDQPQQPRQRSEADAGELRALDGGQTADEQDAPPGIPCQGKPLTKAQKRKLKREQAAEGLRCPGEPGAAASQSE